MSHVHILEPYKGHVLNLWWPEFTSFLPPIVDKRWNSQYDPPNVNIDIKKMTPYKINSHLISKLKALFPKKAPGKISNFNRVSN